MYEIIIGGLSLAIAVGQVFAAPTEERGRTIIYATWAVCGIIIVTSGYQYYHSYQHHKRIEAVARLVLNVMDRPQTFDDIYTRLNFPNFSEVDQAFDALFESSRIRHDVIQLETPDRNRHYIRLFSKANP